MAEEFSTPRLDRIKADARSFGERVAKRSGDVADAKQELIKAGVASDDTAERAAMGRSRMQRTATVGSYGGGFGGGVTNLTFATGRPRDPMFYWKENNLPWDLEKVDELKKLRAFFRLLYQTHPTLASAVDIMSKYPTLDMEFRSKNQTVADFFSDLFLTQLEYDEFLVDIGREFWTVGEAFPLGSFDEDLGVWEADELVHPDDVTVIHSPFLKEPRFEMRIPEVIRHVIETRTPAWEYDALMRANPEWAKFNTQDAKMPVSSTLLKHLAFKADTFHPRGLPIMMRGFRSIIQEEMLNAAQDAVAQRLYTPLIVAKLGASASDLGTSVPWVPDEHDLMAFEDALDAALAGDFRVLIHHFALDIEPVLGREVIPDFQTDFDRLTDRQLQIFGMSRTLLNGAGSGETYAADALNRDILTQLLTRYQKRLKRFLRDRMLVVAEAQGFFDYEERGGTKYPIMEEIVETDKETGEKRIVERPKLLVPDVEFRSMSLQDEDSNQQFLEALRANGVPISIRTRLRNQAITFTEEIEQTKNEDVALGMAAEETRKELYLALKQSGLPIPKPLRTTYEPHAMEKGKGNPHTPEEREGGTKATTTTLPQGIPLPSLGTDQPAPYTGLVPTQTDINKAEGGTPSGGPGGAAAQGMPAIIMPSPGGAKPPPAPSNRFKQRPPESDEQRGRMPKKSSINGETLDAADWDAVWMDAPTYSGPTYFEQGPSHIGMRANLVIDPDQPLEEQLDAQLPAGIRY
jgi:hypothetical protein